MIRTNRSEEYIHRPTSYNIRPGYVALADVAQVLIDDESAYALPAKQPTPDVILRADILPERRSHMAL